MWQVAITPWTVPKPAVMMEPEPTPTPVTNPSLHKHPPINTLTRPVNPTSQDEIAGSHFPSQVSNGKMFELLGRGQDRSDSDKLRGFPPHRPLRNNGRTAAICEYLNRISEFFKKSEATGAWSIRFLEVPDNAHIDHPTLMQCRADVAVLRQSPQQLYDPAKLYWSQLEATGDVESFDEREGGAGAQAAWHTGHLLQARPDYISVPGIFFNATHFKLLLSNACECYATGFTEWNSLIAQRLLYTWFWRLYHPEVDNSIEIYHGSSEPPKFTVHIDGNTIYEGCSILTTGGAFGRRTTIFDASTVIIKEQFIDIGHGFGEGPILEKIHNHNKGVFPGVVRVGWHGTVKSDGNYIELKEGEVVKSTKNRLVLLDKGNRLTGAYTPREVLMALYDLLEITRILWRKYKILHRDISPNNVLLRSKSKIMTRAGPLSSELGDMCFSEYLLRAKTSPSLLPLPENTETPESTSPQANGLSPSLHLLEKVGTDLDLARLSTRTVLIDFDMAEDQTPVVGRTEESEDRIGTPIFMARAVRADHRRKGPHWFFAMPQLSIAQAVYRGVVGDRLQTFPPDEKDFDLCEVEDTSPLSPFQHKLRYDAESVFWLLLWWSLQIKPEGKEDPQSETFIQRADWSMLASEIDRRDGFIFNFPKNILDAEYQPLERLLKQMARQLSGDHDLHPSKQHDEYLHEAFQRLILEFLFANYDKPFMDLKTQDEFRKVNTHDAMLPPLYHWQKETSPRDGEGPRRPRPTFIK